MKLAVSNIAWPTSADADVAALLGRLDIGAIEVAPTKIWPDLLAVKPSELRDCRAWWLERGIEIVSAQALLFGHPELTIFESAEVRQQTLAYLCEVIGVCAALGARALVFGSPKNRRTFGRPADEVQAIATEFFRSAGEVAHRAGTALVLEANPSEYGADYLTAAPQSLALVRAIDHPGVRLHLDTGCMTLAGDDVESIVAEAAELLAHFHVSEPYLAPIGQGAVDHARFAAALERSPYSGWISAEMNQRDPFDLAGLEAALRATLSFYGGVASRSGKGQRPG